LADLSAALLQSGADKKLRTPTNAAGLIRNEVLVAVGVIDADLAAQARKLCHAKARSLGRASTGDDKARSERVSPLRGLAFCGACGSALLAASATGRGGEAHSYLRCAGRNRRTCTAPELPADAWAAFAQEQLSRNQESLARRASLMAERGMIAAKIKRLLSLVEDGSASGSVAKERLAELEAACRAIDDGLSQLEGVIKVAVEIVEQRRAFMANQLSEGLRRLETTTPKEVGAILGGLIHRADLTANPATIRLSLYVPGQPSGPWFDKESRLVEAEGIEPSSEHVRTPRLRV